MADSTVIISNDGLDELLNTPDGPVGALLADMSAKMTEAARVAAPVMKHRRRLGESWYGPAGATKASVKQHFPGYTKAGTIFGGTDVLYGPTLFLERPARQYDGNKEYAFMSEALDTAEL